jgi:hypothetical protein
MRYRYLDPWRITVMIILLCILLVLTTGGCAARFGLGEDGRPDDVTITPDPETIGVGADRLLEAWVEYRLEQRAEEEQDWEMDQERINTLVDAIDRLFEERVGAEE